MTQIEVPMGVPLLDGAGPTRDDIQKQQIIEACNNMSMDMYVRRAARLMSDYDDGPAMLAELADVALECTQAAKIWFSAHGIASWPAPAAGSEEPPVDV